jgi:hypothetical protein
MDGRLVIPDEGMDLFFASSSAPGRSPAGGLWIRRRDKLTGSPILRSSLARGCIRRRYRQ